jgi:hypothetical protein
MSSHTARHGIFNYLTGNATCRTPRPVDEAEGLIDAHRAEVLAEGAVELDRIADEAEARVATHFGQASGIGPGSAELVREAARTLRSMAGGKSTRPELEPLVVFRFDTAIEPAPEEEPILTVGAIAEDGRPVALLLDEETRAKVAGWLGPGDHEAYDGELTMLRGLVRTLRVVVREDDTLPEVRRLLHQHASDDADAREENTPAEKRQADLLTAIRAHGGRWKSGRAVRVLRMLGHHPVSPKTAASDLYQLAEAGHLIRHEEKGVRWYSVARQGVGRG